MKKYLINKKHKIFTCENPNNTFIIDYSNKYPVQVTTNVTKNTKWSDIFSKKYKFANLDGTPEYIYFNGEKYNYIDYKYALKNKYVFMPISGDF